MNLKEALTEIDQLCGVSPSELKTQLNDTCQALLARMAARNNFQISPIKDEFNRVVNEKAHQFIEQYGRILRDAEIDDYGNLSNVLGQHIRIHLQAHYSEACHQLDRQKAALTTLAPSSDGIHLQADYEKMLRWVDVEIRILAAKLKKAAHPQISSAARPVVNMEGLIPLTFPCNSANARVRNLCDELKGISPVAFPNACAFLLRSFIEISAHCFLDAKGEVKKMHAEYLADIATRNSGRPLERQIKPAADWTPDLSAMMKRLSIPGNGFLKNHTTKALGKVINEEQELFGLNLSIHNPAYHPTEARLRATWQNLEEFFREILA